MPKKLFILISILIVSTGLFAFLAYDNLETIFAKGDLIWTQTINPSNSYDMAYSITSDDTYVYIGGYDRFPGNMQWRIEKRQKSNGNLVWTQINNPSEGYDAINSITSDDTYIYIGGVDYSPGNSQWRIEKRQKSDGVLIWTQTRNPSNSYDAISAITSDNTYIYIGGYDSSSGSSQWRMEKRRKSDGNLVWTKKSNPSEDLERVTSITADDTYIYIGGYDISPGNMQWRMEKRRKSDGNLVWTKTSNPTLSYDAISAITSDDTYIYIGGYETPGNPWLRKQWRIEKRRKSDGNLVWTKTSNPSEEHDAITAITSDNTYIYIGGYANSFVNSQWRIEKRRKSDGNLIWTQTIDPSGEYDTVTAITSDNTYIYISGYDKSPSGRNNYQWRIEKRSKGLPSIGFIKIQTSSGIIKLNVKAIGDADANDIVRIGMPGGVTGVADMVSSANRNGSPVKIYLGTTYGTKYWRKID